MEICILEVNKKNLDGQKFSEKDFDQALQLVKEDSSLVQLDDNFSTGHLSIAKIAGVFDNLYFDDNKLYGNFRILNTPSGEVLKKLATTKKLYITPFGIASSIIEEDGTVNKYWFYGWNIADNNLGSSFECAEPIVIDQE